MPIIQVPQGVWTKITTTDKNGEVFHKNGTSQIFYVEQTNAPLSRDVSTPVSMVTDIQESFTYYKIDAVNFLWAYCALNDATVTVTPVGV